MPNPILFTLAIAVTFVSGCRAQTAPAGVPDANIVASWDFEKGLEPTFARDGWKAGAKFEGGQPRFVDGFRGRGLAIEEPSRNLLSPAASGLFSDAKPFSARGDASLSVEKSGALVGNNALKIETSGQSIGEGFAVAFVRPDVAAGLAGEISLKGKGRLRARLFDPDNYVLGPPLYFELTPDWKQYMLPPLDFTAGGKGDLQLIVETADKTATTFWADRIGAEPNPYATSWQTGGMGRGTEKLEYQFGEGASELKQGTILMWVKFLWNDDTTLAYEGRDAPRRFVDTGNGGPELYWTKYNQLRMGTNNISDINTLDGKWHLLGVSWTEKGNTIFADAKENSRIKVVSFNPKKPLVFGPYANVIIDDVVLMDKALTAAQVEKIWKDGQ